MKKALSLALALILMVSVLPAIGLASAPENYNLEISATLDSDGKVALEVYNGNSFVVNDITLVIDHAGEKSEQKINSIAKKSTWKTGDETQDYSEFNAVGYYQGNERTIDKSLFDPQTGIYSGDPYHALVWPDDDLDADWAKHLKWEFPSINTIVTADFIARGPRVAYSGHSFTGYWDSSYYYFRELAKMGGWNAQIAYSYWGGTGLAHHAGLIKDTEPRAQQTEKVLEANEYYDYYSVAGNSNEALTTTDGLVGSTNFSQRGTMEQGARILNKKATAKGAQMILWSTRGYRFGFFTDLSAKPWREGKVGEIYVANEKENLPGGVKVGQEFTLSMTSEEMARINAAFYEYLAETIGDGSSIVAHVGTAYDYINKYYSDKVNPYLTPEQGGDWGHQNNLGNYIAACVYYALIFGESPQGLGIPESHTWGMPGGAISEEQAKIIQEAAWKVVSGEYSLLTKH